MTERRMRLVLIVGLMLLPVAARGQSSATGGIAGVVRDTSGAVMPGVTVEATSPVLIEKVRTVTTDDQGQYKIIDLRPGTYEVTFTLTGFSTVKREGIELTTGFTANANAELRVGSLEETITVTGASPVVDVQNVRSQSVLSNDHLETLPSGKSLGGYAALTFNARVSGAQDVGGNKSDQTVNITTHGNRGPDGRLMIDGMSYGTSVGSGGYSARNVMINQISVQEITLQTGGNSADAETGGTNLNVVPKEGGNSFKYFFSGAGTGPKLQSNNLTDDLRARGLNSAQFIKKLWDFGGGLGGPMKRNQVWFFTGNRWWGAQEYAPGNYFNATQGTMFYTPDLSRPAYTDTNQEAHDIRVTWQAAAKHKISLFELWEDNCQCFIRVDSSNAAPEAVANNHYYPTNLFQGTWNYTVTNRLLFQAGFTDGVNSRDQRPTDGVKDTDIGITEQSTGYVYNADTAIRANNTYGNPTNDQRNARASMSYITGSHAFKAGLDWLRADYVEDGYTQPIRYTFRKPTPDAAPVPLSVTQLASPHHATSYGQKYGLYVQDQWTVRRMTLNLGMRYDYLRGYIPAQTRPGGRFVPELKIEAQNNIPNWKDLSPRLGAAYDLFGNGRTALKGSFGRYPLAEVVGTTVQIHPATAIVTSASRNWNDFFYPEGDPRRGNYIPDCNLNDPLPNGGECQGLSPSTFGTVVINRRYSDDVLRGWNIRPSTSQASLAVQHEIRPNVGVIVGYYRTWYGNFQVTDNLAVTPADYDQFCITAPVDARLPGGGGNQLCGFYDIKPTLFGRSNNLVIRANGVSRQTEVYDGIDVGVSARFGRGGQISGGVSTGQTVIDRCQPIDSPDQRFCREVNPWSGQTQYKASMSYPLPWSLQVSTVLQNLPGLVWSSSYVATNAQTFPTLGRNQGSCGTAAVCNGTIVLNNLFEPNTLREPRLTQVDLRFTKILRVGRGRLRANLDVYNVFNENAVGSLITRYDSIPGGGSWLRPTSIMGGRLVKLGADIDF